jgi:acetyltransferase-like isoleucine patch superfamily enzyme
MWARAALADDEAIVATSPTPAAVRLHPTAIVEAGVEIGDGTDIWDGVHVRTPCRIGRNCIVGEKTYIAYGVEIGDGVKLNAHVYVCTGVTIGDRVMVSAGVIFTNDRYPRAFGLDGVTLAASGPTVDTLATCVEEGATLGAGARIGPGLTIGAYAMVGMGSVVIGDVPRHGLVYGSPARLRGYVCICGVPLFQLAAPRLIPARAQCTRCGRTYGVHKSGADDVQLVLQRRTDA